MKVKKLYILLFLLFAAALLIPMLFLGGSSTQDTPTLCTPALNVLANQTSFVKTASYGERITFQAPELDRAFGMEELSAVTILSLPSPADGTLRLGALPVAKNQTISRRDFAALVFEPTSAQVESASFVLCNHGETVYNLTCMLSFAPATNQAPTLLPSDQPFLTQSTLANISISNRMHAYDPDGDAVSFTVSAYPKKGVLTFSAQTGSYTYLPRMDEVGSDRFCYYATDRYGASSQEYTVTVSISPSEHGLLYTDLIGHEAHHAAICLTASGIMSGSEIGGLSLFQPTKEVSRSDFLVMAMKSVDYPLLSTDAPLPFADSDAVSPAYKDYLYTAYQAGIVQGEIRADGRYFHPEQTITRAQAAVIVQRLLQAAVPTVTPAFADADDVPTWAENAIAVLCSLGMMDMDEHGNIRATESMTRAESARLLHALYNYMQA